MVFLIILGITLFLFSLILFILSYRQKVDNTKELKLKYDLLRELEEIRNNTEELEQKRYDILKDLSKQEQEVKEYYFQEKDKINSQLDVEKENLKNQVESFKINSQTAMANYFSSIEENYNNIDKEYDEKIEKLKTEYNNVNKDLESLKATLSAATEARLREEEKKNNLDFYKLQITSIDLDDILKLNSIKPMLHNPVILSKLIWSTYFQKPYKALCSKVLGDATVTGIYKITDLTTEQCYIGQSVDIAKRWSDHIKAGLGIDNNGTNKLYKAMQAHGVENFTFELLESCERKLLDEKEKFFIALYQSDIYGLNVTKGNG